MSICNIFHINKSVRAKNWRISSCIQKQKHCLFKSYANYKDHHSHFLGQRVPFISFRMSSTDKFRDGFNRVPITVPGFKVTKSIPFSSVKFLAACSAAVFPIAYHFCEAKYRFMNHYNTLLFKHEQYLYFLTETWIRKPRLIN